MRSGRAGVVAAVVLVVALAATAEAERAPKEAPTPPRAARKPLLWRVEASGRSSYLFGTVHLPLDLDAALGPVGRAALADAQRVFVEIDVTEYGSNVEFLKLALSRAEMPPGRSLQKMLAPPAWKRLTKLNEGRFPPETLDRFEPWFAALFTVPAVIDPARSRNGKKPSPHGSLDAEITARMKERGRKVMPLETPLQHIQAIAGAGRHEGVVMLEEMLGDPEALRQELEGLVGAYQAQDDRPILKSFGRLRRRRPTFAEHVLFRRNERWCERLVHWLHEGKIFLAAGAFHMFGDRGLVALLRARGFTVERVRDLPGPPAPT